MSNIIRVRDLNLVFRTSVYRSWTWREAFVRAVKDPLDVFPGQDERLHILKNISFDVSHGDRIGLLGVNGVGKTSLCRCIAGFYQPTSGQVERNGSLRALFDVAVGVQHELTGRENAWLLAELMFPGEPEMAEIVNQALEFSELGKFLDTPFRLYSKGMQARLGLSLSAFRPADLLILDEVFDGADMFFREKISAKMLDLMRDSGAVIFVSHAADQIRLVCNRLILLNQGRIIFDGAVDEGLSALEGLRPRPVEAGLNV
jgi:ABC-type polysaccharide/polyol phosphate transport system ATPase subunit